MSGLVSDRFCFDGFLPRKGAERGTRLAALVGETRTTVLFEAPHRVLRTSRDLYEVIGPHRRVVLARELTKRFEEVWRGTLEEAVEHLATVEPRGEYVLILEGRQELAATSEDIEAALRVEFAHGASTRDAVATVVEMTGAKKRQVYDLALRLAD